MVRCRGCGRDSSRVQGGAAGSRIGALCERLSGMTDFLGLVDVGFRPVADVGTVCFRCTIRYDDHLEANSQYVCPLVA